MKEILLPIKELLKSLVIRLHLAVFKTEPGDFTKRLLKNLFFALFGVGGVTLITFGVNILAVRYLGPSEYGKVNLIISVGEFLLIPILWGLSSSALRYLGAERENSESVIGSSFRAVFLLSIIFSAIFVFAGPFFQPIFKIPENLYWLALIYAVISAFFYLFQSFFQGLEKFKKLSLIWLVGAVLFAVAVLFQLFYLKNFDFSGLFWGNIIRLVPVILVGIIIFRDSLFKFNKDVFKRVFNYGTFNMLSVFAGFFSLGNIDNLMLNYYLGPAAVGLYAAYYMSFNVFISKIQNTFSQVFLPMASGVSDIRLLYRRSLEFFKKAGILIFLGNLFLIWVLFKFYGKLFVFDWRLAGLMAFSVTAYSFLMILGNIVASVGVKGAKLGIFFSIIAATFNLAFNIILIPKLGIAGSIIGTILTAFIVILIAGYFIKFKLADGKEI